MKKEEIYKIAPYVEEHYKRCWVEGYIAGLQAKDPTLDDIAEKYAEKLDISKGWFDGCEIDELIKESYKAGFKDAEHQKPEQIVFPGSECPKVTGVLTLGPRDNYLMEFAICYVPTPEQIKNIKELFGWDYYPIKEEKK